MGPNVYTPEAVHFDGVNDYLRSLTFSGTDSKQLTGSMWVRFEGDAVAGQALIRDNASRINIFRHASEYLWFSINDGSGNDALDLNTSALDTKWHHVLFSFDMSDVNKRHFYIDDIDEVPTYTNYNDLVLRLSVPTHAIGGNTAGGSLFNGDIADFWFDHGTYMDFSIEANRRKFIDANGYPVDLGADGSLPTGNVPEIFLSGDHLYWQSNKGTNAGFTENGELTDASFSLASTREITNGLVGWWRLDEITYVSAADSSYNGNEGDLQGGLDPSIDSVAGKIGTALNFDGVNDYITVALGLIHQISLMMMFCQKQSGLLVIEAI
jgi:hypothetical protein